MIESLCFTKKWINQFKTQKAYRNINPPVLEKMIHALALLEQLQIEGLSFVFKGGTSLILLLKEAKRFSVDIDIITQQKRGTIEAIFDTIVKNSPFTKWTLDEKRSYKTGVPKAHYEFTYASNLNQEANYILLDILFENQIYPQLIEVSIKTQWIVTDKEIKVNVPSIDSIVGDKLTAFAPNTTGVPYQKGKETEIIKQLFDLSCLFDEIQSIQIVQDSFLVFAQQEIAYRSLDINVNDVLVDTFETCKMIALRERNQTEPEKSHFKEMQIGLRRFKGFLINTHFRIDDAIVAAAKVAYLTTILQQVTDQEILKSLIRYENQDISNWLIIDSNWNVLNRLKKLPNKSAFFYWYKTLELLEIEIGEE